MFVGSLYQPWLTQWGSTGAEQLSTLPGDAIVANARQWTRSITIDAAPEQVWPWLVQMGVDKGGFDTYERAEQLFAHPMHNTWRIHLEWQRLAVGDEVHIAVHR